MNDCSNCHNDACHTCLNFPGEEHTSPPCTGHLTKLEAARQKLRATLKANPDLAKAFKETLDDMRKPENIEKMAAEIDKGMEIIKKLRGGMLSQILPIVRGEENGSREGLDKGPV